MDHWLIAKHRSAGLKDREIEVVTHPIPGAVLPHHHCWIFYVQQHASYVYTGPGDYRFTLSQSKGLRGPPPRTTDKQSDCMTHQPEIFNKAAFLESVERVAQSTITNTAVKHYRCTYIMVQAHLPLSGAWRTSTSRAQQHNKYRNPKQGGTVRQPSRCLLKYSKPNVVLNHVTNARFF